MATPSKAFTETSVMMSLRELRAIEDARRVDEAMARERATEDARRRAIEAEEAARAQAAAALAARLEDARRAREAEAQAAREAELRVREAEARARVDADAALAARRLDQEMQVRRLAVQRTRPRALLGALGGLLAVVLGLGGLYVAANGRVRGLDDQLTAERAKADASAARVAALQKASHDEAGSIAALRAEVDTLGKPVFPIATSPVARPDGGATSGHGHGHGHVVHTGGTTGTIDLGACADQPLLCNN